MGCDIILVVDLYCIMIILYERHDCHSNSSRRDEMKQSENKKVPNINSNSVYSLS